MTEIYVVTLVLRWFACLSVMVILVGGVAVSPAERAEARAFNAVYEWLLAEERAWKNDDRDQFLTLVDESVNANWRRDWLHFWKVAADERDTLATQLNQVVLHSNIVEAQTLVSRQSADWWRSSPYRESRFYRSSEKGLRRTLPGKEFWGTVGAVETRHVRLEHYEPDARIAAAVAPRLDAYYVQLYELLDLARSPTARKLTFVLDHRGPRGRSDISRRQILTSPLLSRIPAALSDEEFVLHQMVSSLTFFALAEALSDAGGANLYRWEILLWSLDGWLQTDGLGQRTPWHTQAEKLLRMQPPKKRPLELARVGEWRSRGVPQQEAIMRQYVIAESVIAYIVEEYGREKIPDLLAALPQHNNWPDLVAATLAVDFKHFETAWNQYLAQRFGWE